MTHDEGHEFPKERLSQEGVLVNNFVSPDFTQILALRNVLGPAGYGGQEAIERLQTHRALITEAFENFAHTLKFCVGQWLRRHGASCTSHVLFKKTIGCGSHHP